MKTLKLGFKRLPHAEKKAHKKRLAQMAYDNPQTAARIASMVKRNASHPAPQRRRPQVEAEAVPRRTERGMNYDEAQQLLKTARLHVDAADSLAEGIATLLVGRLRKVRSGHTLRALKKELANYDMTTGRWKP